MEPGEWFADEEFWAATFPHMFPQSRIDAAAGEVDQILALAGVTAGRVLDMGCGPGRHSVALAQRAFAVTGVDRSEFLLSRGREHASANDVDVEWIHSDMRDFIRPATFDLAFSMFTSFGFFEKDEDNQKVLANLFASLAPGGTLVMDMGGREVIAKNFQPTGSQEIPGGWIVQRRQTIDDWSRLANEWILIEGQRVRSFRFQVWLYSGRELKQMLLRAGFDEVRICGDLGGRPYDLEARRLVAVASRAG